MSNVISDIRETLAQVIKPKKKRNVNIRGKTGKPLFSLTVTDKSSHVDFNLANGAFKGNANLSKLFGKNVDLGAMLSTFGK